MHSYKIHYIDKTGRTVRTLTVDMESDVTAAALACTLHHSYAIEVRRGEKRIAVIAADDKAPSFPQLPVRAEASFGGGRRPWRD